MVLLFWRYVCSHGFLRHCVLAHMICAILMESVCYMLIMWIWSAISDVMKHNNGVTLYKICNKIASETIQTQIRHHQTCDITESTEIAAHMCHRGLFRWFVVCCAIALIDLCCINLYLRKKIRLVELAADKHLTIDDFIHQQYYCCLVVYCVRCKKQRKSCIIQKAQT